MADAEPEAVSVAGVGGALARVDEEVATHGPRIVHIFLGIVQFCGFAWTWATTVLGLGVFLVEGASGGHWCPDRSVLAAPDHGYRNVSFLLLVVTVRNVLELLRYICCVYTSWAFPDHAPPTPQQQRRQNASRLLLLLIKLVDLFVVWDGVHFFLDPPTAASCAVQHLPDTLLFIRVFIVYTWISTALHLCVLALIGAVVLYLLTRVSHQDEVAPPVSAAIVEQATRLVARTTADHAAASPADTDGSDSSLGESDTATCAICLSRLSADDVRHLACGHAFHDACITPHLTRYTSSCPLCRQAITSARDLHQPLVTASSAT